MSEHEKKISDYKLKILKNLEALVVKFKEMMKEESKSIHQQSIDI